MIRNKYFVLVLLFSNVHLHSVAPVNIFNVQNTNNLSIANDNKWQISVTAEGAISNKGHNSDGDTVNALQIYESDQNSLTSLRGFSSTSTIGKLAAKLNSANDDGVRGHITPTAKLETAKTSILLQRKLPYNLTLSVEMPVYFAKLKDVSLTDNTLDITASDKLTKTNLTNDIAANIKTLGGLDIANGWTRKGLGDLKILLGWQQKFIQANPILKEVYLGVHGGLTLPTSKRADEDKLFAIPFGHDGAVGIMFGSKIHVQWWQHLRAGINADFLKLFDAARERRVKTDLGQTSLFLLAKAKTRKDWGLTQQYNLYLEGFNLFDTNMSLRTGYLYAKHNDDKLNILSNDYFGEIANTANSLKEWTQHSVEVSLRYEGRVSVVAYYKHPFNGKNTVQSRLVGCTVGMNF